MVLARINNWESKFYSQSVLNSTEKLFADKDRNIQTRDRWARGRNMVSEELRFSKVDVKGRQQLFENMANKKEPSPSKNNRSMTRSHSTENHKVKYLVSSRNARSVSAEPSYRKNEDEKPLHGTSQNKPKVIRPDLGTDVNKKTELQPGSRYDELTLKNIRNKEDRSELHHNRTPVKKVLIENVLKKKGGSAGKSLSVDCETRGTRERKERVIQSEKRAEAKILDTGDGTGETKKVRNRVKALEDKHSDHAETGASKTNLKAVSCGKINKDENFEDMLGLKENNQEGIVPRTHSEEVEPVLHRPFRRSIEITATSRKRSADGSKMLEGALLGMEKECETFKQQEEPEGRNSSLTLEQRDGRSDGLIQAQQDIGPVSEQLSEKPRPKSVQRKPSMKIIVTGKSIENPTPKRTATIIRVNSKVSDCRGLHEHSATNCQNSNESQQKQGTGDKGIWQQSNDEGVKDVLVTMPATDRQAKMSIDEEDGSSYYRDVRYGLRGRKGIPAENQDLLTDLLSIENTDKAKSLGLSEELIELLREEEGFWKRQVELKKWRESKESKPIETESDKVFDAAKEKRIAQLRKEHEESRYQDFRNASEELTVEELKQAEDKFFAEESRKLHTSAGIPQTNKEIGKDLPYSSSTPNQNETVIFLKQHPFENQAILSKMQSQKGINRFSYPPTFKSEFSDSGSSLDRQFNRELRSESHGSSGSLSKAVHSVSTDVNKAPRLSSVSSGPITYFEHMARVLRGSLVAEPYASHPQRKPVELSRTSQKDLNVDPGSHSKQESFDSAGYSAVEDSTVSYKKNELVKRNEVCSPSYENLENSRLDSYEDPFSPDIGSFDFDSEKEIDHSRNYRASENLFQNLKSSQTYWDPSYFSLIDNPQPRTNNFVEEETDTVDPPSIRRVETADDSVCDSKSNLLHKGSPSYLEGKLADTFDGESRTYHVTSVAYRYSRPSASSVKVDSHVVDGPSKHHPGTQSKHYKPDVHSDHPVNSTTPYSDQGNKTEGVPSKYKARTNSENETVSPVNLNPRDYFSDDESNEERTREARQLVISEDFRIRCSCCRRLICEKLLMTVADTELFWHCNCFYCSVCGIFLVKQSDGGLIKVRLIKKQLHCTTCYSQDGEQLSVV
ncbi:uncharacterized protein LOC135686709 isoform X2 [Rhopilema esculentum]